MIKMVPILSLLATVSIAQTTFDKKYQVEVITIDSVSIETNDQDQLDSIAKKYDNSHRRARAFEAYRLDKFNPGVTRDSDDLVNLRLLNGSTLRLIPDNNKEEVDFTYDGYFKDKKLVVFRVQWYEGNNYAVIDLRDGKKTYMLGRPVISPDNRMMVAFNCDIEAQYSGSGFQLFEVGREIRKVWEFQPTDWGPAKVQWLDNGTIVSQNIKFDNQKGGFGFDHTKIVVKRNAP